MAEQNNAEVVETVVTERQTFHANLNRFDEELYSSMNTNEKCEYLTSLINHSDKYESFWNLTLPIDSDPAISNEILSSFVVYADDKSNKPLDLYKADVSTSGKSFVIVWSSFVNSSKAVVKLKQTV